MSWHCASPSKSSALFKKVESKTPYREYRFLWNTLLFFGIDFYNDQSGKMRKVATKIVPFTLHITQLLLVCATLISVSKNNISGLVAVAYLLVSLSSTFLWHLVFRRRKRIRNIMAQLCKLEESLMCSVEKRGKAVMNLVVLTALVYPSTCAFLSTWYLPVAPVAYRDYYNLYIPIENRNITGFVWFILLHVALVILHTLPTLKTITCSFLYYKLGEIMKGFCSTVDGYQKRCPTPESLRRQLRLYRAVFNIAEEVENELSVVTFLLLCSQVTVMFVTMASFVTQEVFPAIFWECLPSITIVPLCVVGEIVCASRVSRYVQRSRISLKKFRDKLVSEEHVDTAELGLVDAMKEEIFPSMTAWGVVELKSSLIPTVFGSLFTYGVLIVNMEFTGKEC